MCVGLVTHFAKVGLIRCVDVHVFLSVTAVCKPPVTAFKLTLERFLSCGQKKKKKKGQTVSHYIFQTSHLNKQ